MQLLRSKFTSSSDHFKEIGKLYNYIWIMTYNPTKRVAKAVGFYEYDYFIDQLRTQQFIFKEAV